MLIFKDFGLDRMKDSDSTTLRRSPRWMRSPYRCLYEIPLSYLSIEKLIDSIKRNSLHEWMNRDGDMWFIEKYDEIDIFPGFVMNLGCIIIIIMYLFVSLVIS